jgi:hypothetical protein
MLRKLPDYLHSGKFEVVLPIVGCSAQAGKLAARPLRSYRQERFCANPSKQACGQQDSDDSAPLLPREFNLDRRRNRLPKAHPLLALELVEGAVKFAA